MNEPLLPAPLVVTGHLVTFDEQRPEIPDGALYVDRDGLIVAVTAADAPPPPGFEQANRVDTGADAIVYPGLIDLHNHIAYNCLPLWIAPGRSAPWTARDQWPKDPDYLPSISLPVNALCKANGKAVLKYVETKAVVGGVTAIQGSSKVGRPFEGWMVRNIEYETFRTGRVGVRQAVFALEGEKEFARTKARAGGGRGVRLPPRRGDRRGAGGRVRRARHERDPGAALRRDPLHGARRRAVRRLGAARRLDRLVAVLEPVALRRDDRRRRGARARHADLPRRGLVAVGLEVAARRAEGGRPVESLALGRAVLRARSVPRWRRATRPTPWAGRAGSGGCGRGCTPTCWSWRAREDDVYRNLVTSIEADVLLVTINGYPMYGVGVADGGGRGGRARSRSRWRRVWSGSCRCATSGSRTRT